MSKRNRTGERGLVGALPIRHMVSTLVIVDFIDRPQCETYTRMILAAFFSEKLKIMHFQNRNIKLYTVVLLVLCFLKILTNVCCR